MGQHAKRFDAVGAQKGTGLRAVVDQLKAVADTAEEWFDPNSAEMVSAMQRFEMGLNMLKGAPARPESSEPAKSEKPRAGQRKPATPKSEKAEESDTSA